MEADFELNNHLYAKAKLKDYSNVYLWLGVRLLVCVLSEPFELTRTASVSLGQRNARVPASRSSSTLDRKTHDCSTYSGTSDGGSAVFARADNDHGGEHGARVQLRCQEQKGEGRKVKI